MTAASSGLALARCVTWVAVAATACSSSKATDPPSLHRPLPPPAAEQPYVARGPIPASTTTLITGITDGWTSTTVTLQLWHREAGPAQPPSAGQTIVTGAPGDWRAVGAAWSGVVGRSGLGWGVGLHGAGRPATIAAADGPIKAEGDGRAPAGAFSLGRAFGYAPSAASALSYQSVDEHWHCVDDPASSSYAKIVDDRVTKRDWTSAEDMRRKDALYTWVIDVQHNPDAAKRAGSCIFFHVWSGPTSSTVGCTAMPEATLRDLVTTLPADAIYVLLPRAAYRALATQWDLPPR